MLLFAVAFQAFIMKRCRDRNIVQFLGTAVDREQVSADA